MARPRTRAKTDNGVPPAAISAAAHPSVQEPRASTLDEVLEQVRKIAAAERELRALQGSLRTLRDGLRGLVDQLSGDDQEIYRSILSVEPTRRVQAEDAPAAERSDADWREGDHEA